MQCDQLSKFLIGLAFLRQHHGCIVYGEQVLDGRNQVSAARSFYRPRAVRFDGFDQFFESDGASIISPRQVGGAEGIGR